MKRLTLQRFAIFIAYIVLAVLAAGAFGMVHDQISYTVSPEYFTKFKFLQFRLLDPEVPERLRAAKVGFPASWWMGIPLGVLTGLAGFIHPNVAQMRKALWLSLAVVTAFTLVFALGGLAYGFVQTMDLDLAAYRGWFIPKGLEYPQNFICTGYMHNAAYLGGVIAIPVAWLFHVAFRRHVGGAAGRGVQPGR